ncbi:MAG: aminoacyl-tRNA hydrolase [Bdellovibrionaceae bacterium]|nr:aminoacyl-tRNA hydrolase [Bdellovibrionales bacterium]MCB9084431.1 aminoacyl-tRNA hydrolase [Pseudobdellovibrionaceae bacterium]
MQIIVGLGNPGPKYQLTRHNVGFMAIDALAHAYGEEGSFKKEHKALTAKVRIDGQVVLLAKPQTYMNLSGESVQALMSYYGGSPQELLVVHDEVDLPYASIRYQKNRGHGGHNGIRNIHQLLGTQEYNRLKLGVSRPANPRMDVADFVLQNFNNDEMNSLPDFLSLASESMEAYIRDGFEKAATRYNRTTERD